jgi:AcrR family transcriptional regulator
MRQRIIEGALRIFVQQGIRATTMDDIAKQLGISKRTIYEHFQDKKELLMIVADYSMVQSKKCDREIFDNSQNVLEGFLILMKKKRSEMNVKLMKTMIELKRYYPEIIDEMRQKHSVKSAESFEATFNKGIDEGVFRADLNPRTSAFLFSTQAYMFISEQMNRMDISALDDADISVLQVFEDLFLNFLRGISTQEGIKIIEKHILENAGKKTVEPKKTLPE